MEKIRIMSKREDLWRVIRIMKTFTVIDVQVTARGEEVLLEERVVEEFLDLLERADYVERIGEGRWYRLLINSGHRAPEERDNRLYDPNFNAYIFLKEKKV